MKSRVIWLFATLLIATAVVFSQNPPQPAQSPRPVDPPMQPASPHQPGHAQQPFEPHQPAPHQPVHAQQPFEPHQPAEPQQAPHPPRPPHDPIAGNLFPPEFVMQHRSELGLTDEQKTAIKDEAIKASTRFNELQWQMQDELETMATLMKSPTIDEQRALAQLDKVLNIEREVKRTQLGLSIRIKNKLTPEQQGKLHELQRTPHPPR